MIDEQTLREGLQRLLKDTESAIRDRLSDEPSLEAQLRERHSAAVRAERTEGSAKGYTAFTDEIITQAAVHWLLGCVFVRFLEDNGWLDERNAKVAWIAGGGERLWVARDRRTLFLRPNPNLTDRDYLLYVFAEAAKLPGVAGLFDQKHNPLYLLQPTGQGAAKIVEFFQRVDPDSNQLIHDFKDPAHGTRFLGDLYQNLSESARKRYALCQTPGFVIDFILDRTLTPALDAFGLETVRMIDPSCGSGHFLLAAFARLFRAWQSKESGTNPPALVQRALDAVYGVDLNPFAVEISRFRLLIAALESSGIERLADGPDFRFNVAAGDSLLHGSRIGGGGIARELFEDRLQHFYATENAEELKQILGQAYHVVVGNPPYINVSDAMLREAYRARFETCHGKYQLGVPFTERFFDLTIRTDTADGSAGWIGMIVSNAFMKRTFGKKLIESYFSRRDLTHVIDTSGVYLPGHGTPTTILLARHRPPVSKTIRAVRGIRGETGVPEDPSSAPVWREITEHIELPGFSGKLVSVADAARDSFAEHPWAIGGGGVAELKIRIDEESGSVLNEWIREIGFFGILGADDVMKAPTSAFATHHVSETEIRPLVVGEHLRDWQSSVNEAVYFPYDENGIRALQNGADRWFWRFCTTLGTRPTFSQKTFLQEGRPWWGWHQISLSRLKPAASITYGEIATHNHFVLERGGKVFNQTAPVLKLGADATEDQHLELLGILNSSTACFWLKQICYVKGEGVRGLEAHAWMFSFAFDGTKLKQLPIPAEKPLDITREIQIAVDRRARAQPQELCSSGAPTTDSLYRAKEIASESLARMIGLQEELDWRCYKLYGLIEEDLTLPTDQIPALNLGERAFEIVLAQGCEEPEWLNRQGSNSTTEIPGNWSAPYRRLVERRIAVIASNPEIALIERPEYKRPWFLASWDTMQSAALKSWLLHRMEANEIWQERKLVSAAQLRNALARDLEWVSVAEIYHGEPVEDLDRFVISLAIPEAVPALPHLRYTESGLRKRGEWEETWRLQRKEDAGEAVVITTPPKYTPKDFQRNDFWRLRGGLDVPKERFILYPGFQRDSDETPVLAWAGWSHLEQAKALAGYYQRMRNEEGWEPERLKAVLAGLLDLREWLKQWHDDVPDPETGLKLGTYFSDYAEAQCQELGFSTQEVLAWKPAAATPSGRRKKSKTK